MKTKLLILTIAILGFIVLPLSLSASSNDAIKMVPSWCDFVMYVDAQKLMDQDLLTDNEEIMAGINELRSNLSDVGIDLEDDLHWGVVGVKVPRSAAGFNAIPDFVFVLRADYNIQTIRNAINAKISSGELDDVAVATYSSAPTYQVGTGIDKMYVSLLSNYVVMTNKTNFIDTLISLAAGSGSNVSSNSDVGSVINQVKSANIGWAAVSIPSSLWQAVQAILGAGGGNDPQAQMAANMLQAFSNVKTATLSFSTQGSNSYKLVFNMNTSNATQANQIHQQLSNLWNMMAVPALQSDPSTASIVNNISIGKDGSTVSVTVTMNQAFFDAIESAAGGGSGSSAPRRY
jgi:hypothetical protein